MRPSIPLLLLLLLALIACDKGVPPDPAGPTVGLLPILAGATELEGELPLALTTIRQVHKETVLAPASGAFHVALPLIDTIDWYDDQLRALDWKLIDVLEFGDGGFLRRYHRGEQRAIVAFHPADPDGTDFLLLQGAVKR